MMLKQKKKKKKNQKKRDQLNYLKKKEKLFYQKELKSYKLNKKNQEKTHLKVKSKILKESQEHLVAHQPLQTLLQKTWTIQMKLLRFSSENLINTDSSQLQNLQQKETGNILMSLELKICLVILLGHILILLISMPILLL